MNFIKEVEKGPQVTLFTALRNNLVMGSLNEFNKICTNSSKPKITCTSIFTIYLPFLLDWDNNYFLP